MNDQDSRPITHALEALLGGLGPITGMSEQIANQKDFATSNEPKILEETEPTQTTSFTGSNLKTSVSPEAERGTKLLSTQSSGREKESSPTIPEKSTASLTSDIKTTAKEVNVVGTEFSSRMIASQDNEDAPNTIKTLLKETEPQKANVNTLNEEPEKPTIPGLFLCGSNFPSGLAPQREHKLVPLLAESSKGSTTPMKDNDASLTSIPEHLVTTVSPPSNDDLTTVEAHAEWEIDTSPIEIISDDSSTDTSTSDESEDSEDTYKLLTPEEQAKILMAGDGGSDDEGRDKAKTPGGQLHTKNEILEVAIPKPDVIITEDMPIVELGVVDQVVNNILLIKAKVSGEYKVLESGSVLCLSDRSVFGVVAETIGRVQAPLYSVMFTNASDIAKAGLSIGLTVFYSENHSTFVFTKTLKAFKGSDASNINDEEVGEDEIEFSDDEAEAEHKRQIKQKKMCKRDGKPKANGGSNRNDNLVQKTRGPEGYKQKGIDYDNNEDDGGPYKTLARPVGYADHLGKIEAPLENNFTIGKVKPHSREQNGGRGRADKKKGRDNRRLRNGKARKSIADQVQPSKAPYQQSYNFAPAPAIYPPLSNRPEDYVLPLGTPSHPSYSSPQVNYNMSQMLEYPSHQPHSQQWAQYFSQANTQPQYNQFQPAQPLLNNWANMAPPLPPGTYINPAFFNPQNIPAQPWIQQSQQFQKDNKDMQ